MDLQLTTADGQYFVNVNDYQGVCGVNIAKLEGTAYTNVVLSAICETALGRNAFTNAVETANKFLAQAGVPDRIEV